MNLLSLKDLGLSRPVEYNQCVLSSIVSHVSPIIWIEALFLTNCVVATGHVVLYIQKYKYNYDLFILKAVTTYVVQKM